VVMEMLQEGRRVMQEKLSRVQNALDVLSKGTSQLIAQLLTHFIYEFYPSYLLEKD
jgi:hypothetical protein